MNKNVLITGGNGYLGSNLIQLILQKKISIDKIIIIDNLSNSFEKKKRKLINLSKRIIFFKFDINKKNQLRNVLNKYKINTIFHFASLKNIEESKKNPERYIKKNIFDTISMIESIKNSSVKNIIFSSTAGVYEYNKVNENSENALVMPSNAYSYSKRVCENIFYQLSTKNKINVIILRLFNIMGHIEKNKIFSELRGNVSDEIISSIENEKTFIINSKNLGKEGSIRDFIHVEDVCNANLKAYNYLQTKKMFYDIFNIGSGKSVSIRELITHFNRFSQKKIKYKNSFNRPAGQEKSYANIKKSFKILKWKPVKNIKDICLSEMNFIKNKKR